jgi:xylan 1,4-beta-xylosidase
VQLMCDAVAVLGSRHGLCWFPAGKTCGILRFDRFEALPEVHLRAGIRLGNREITFPLYPEGGGFAFHDQRTSPCTMALIGIDAATNIKVTLTVATPFRPRDAAFSTVPVIALRLTVEQRPGRFRWVRKAPLPTEAELFLEISGPGIAVAESGPDSVDLRFESGRSVMHPGDEDQRQADPTPEPQHDRLLVTTGAREGLGFTRRVPLQYEQPASLEVAWCTHSAPVFEAWGTRLPFKYAERFADLDAVAAWARAHVGDVWANAARVDGLISDNDCSAGANHLLAYSLHAWLACSWWTVTTLAPAAGPLRSIGGPAHGQTTDRFAVWEGTCYCLSSVDVEFSQAPFYLTVWPELLGYQLDAWPNYTEDGTASLGARGRGTRYQAHDIGAHATAGGSVCAQPMEVEENCNYVILAYSYWRTTGEDGPLQRHQETIRRQLDFLIAADSTGDGVPDLAVINTINDGSPALHAGNKQTYLGVKAAAAFAVGAEMLSHVGRPQDAARFRARAALARATVEARAWLGDHYAVLLDKAGRARDAWTGIVTGMDEVPGWNAAHIFTANALAILDLAGYQIGFDNERIITDLRTALRRCLHTYGCVHSDDRPPLTSAPEALPGLKGVVRNPGWVSANMLRDLVALRRGVDLRDLADRYWEWQVIINTQERKHFHDSFGGNDLSWYPRGLAWWGLFSALAQSGLPGVRVLDLTQVTWSPDAE